MMQSRVLVDGMTCSACTAAVTSTLESIKGVRGVSVNLTTECAIVDHDDDVPVAALCEAIEDSGFGATVEPAYDTVILQIGGMTCSACSSAIDSCLAGLEGVSGTVNLATDQASIRYDQNKIGIRSIIEAIEDCGFDAVPNSQASNNFQISSLSRAKQTHEYRQNTLICALFGIPLICISKLQHFGMLQLPSWRALPLDCVICFLLVLPIQYLVGRKIYSKAWKAWRSGNPNMDVLVATSVTLAFAFSLLAMVFSLVLNQKAPMFMWDACAMILLFVSFGKWLENKARGETSKALSSLLSLVPETSIILEAGREKSLATDLLQLGDVILVRPGAKIPVDGIVVEGSTWVSEAILTGESASIPKKVGSEVFSGTTNGQGAVQVRVTMCGTQTKLGQIVALIKEAQASKAPIQRYADRIAGKFVYGILILAVATFVFWAVASALLPKLPMAFSHSQHWIVALRLAISVVVVACPCALGLATPTAVMVASGVGAAHGILVKGGVVFEAMSECHVVLFDKTGTLTEGRMHVLSSTLERDDWKYVAAIEQLSEHPVAAALSEHGAAQCSKVPAATNVLAVPGMGAAGEVDDVKVLVGSRKFLIENGVAVPDATETSTTSYLAVGGECKGHITLSDSVRPMAEEVVAELRARGVRVGMVSGDNSNSVAQIALACGIEPHNVWPEQSPSDKIGVVQELQNLGNKVCMVGDGVNDSPALAAADVGISLEGATQVAVDSADVVLMNQNPLVGVVHVLDLCRAALRRIKMNFLLSVVYNAVLIPVAMGVLLPWGVMLNPANASAAMAVSSVSVVCSSLLLKWWAPAFPSRPSRFSWVLGARSKQDYIPLSSV